VPVLLVLVWVGGLLAAMSVGLLAVRLVAAQVGDPAVAPLSAVAAASGAPDGAAPPATAAPATPTGGPPSSAAPAPGSSPDRPAPSTAPAVATTQTFSTAGGTLGVQCTGTALRLLYRTPAQGYALDEQSVGGSEAEVRFRGAGARVRVRLSCATGVPRLVEQRTDPDGGGEDGDRPDDDRRDDDRPDEDRPDEDRRDDRGQDDD
jgi:hypothetical protein